MGMIFVRFRGGEPSVAERMAPHVPELAHYRMAEMVPLDEMWTTEVAIDWKNVIENYVEDYHFPIGHPGLSALMESQYDRESFPGGTMRLSHRMRETPLKSWSAQGYAKFLPVIEHLPEDMRRRWTYFGLYPNVFFDIYPEWLDFFQVVPLAAGRTLIRARSYGFVDYMSLALEVLYDREEEEAAPKPAPELPTDAEIASAGEKGVVFTFKNPKVRDVQLAGDFNNWIPDQGVETRQGPGGTWEKVVRLGPGVYQYRYFVDGEWTPDPSTPRRVEGPAGGVNSVLIIS
jgi:hypothetical protein